MGENTGATAAEIDQAEEEIARAQRRAKGRGDWTLIAECQRAIVLARLELAREVVRPLK